MKRNKVLGISQYELFDDFTTEIGALRTARLADAPRRFQIPGGNGCRCRDIVSMSLVNVRLMTVRPLRHEARHIASPLIGFLSAKDRAARRTTVRR